MPIRHIAELNPYDTNRYAAFGGGVKNHRERRPDTDKMPPAGPHAKPELTDEEKTPGSGAFPAPGEADNDDMAPTG